MDLGVREPWRRRTGGGRRRRRLVVVVAVETRHVVRGVGVGRRVASVCRGVGRRCEAVRRRSASWLGVVAWRVDVRSAVVTGGGWHRSASAPPASEAGCRLTGAGHGARQDCGTGAGMVGEAGCDRGMLPARTARHELAAAASGATSAFRTIDGVQTPDIGRRSRPPRAPRPPGRSSSGAPDRRSRCGSAARCGSGCRPRTPRGCTAGRRRCRGRSRRGRGSRRCRRAAPRAQLIGRAGRPLRSGVAGGLVAGHAEHVGGQTRSSRTRSSVPQLL